MKNLSQNTALELPIALRKPRLRRWEASEYLNLVHGIQVASTTLAKYVSIGGGPAFQKVNRTPLYPKTELDLWAQAKLGGVINSSSEERQESGV